MSATIQWASWVYLPTLVLLIGADVLRRALRNRRNRRLLRESVETGLTQPASLHPVLDPNQCVGCGACVKACPEGDVLGVIAGKAEVVKPANCIGHGACRLACPMGAISLVFGTEQRGVDIPHVSETFETNVPGLYIAGELGGMGLIRNAIAQGTQAMNAIIADLRGDHGNEHDVIVVGAGPAGFAATLRAHEAGLRYLTLEQETFGGTVAHFPRGKLVMTAPVHLPLFGKVKLREVSKEKLLAFWEEVRSKTGIRMQFRERMERMQPTGNGFVVTTQHGEYRAARVLLAIGRRGTPRKLGVANEDLPKVVYRLVDPAQYAGQAVLVVGGGDSALEAAVSIAGQPGSRVTLSYRGDAFGRAKPANRERVSAAQEAGRLRVVFNSTVASLTPSHVTLKHPDGNIELENEAVIVCAGGVLPTPMLKEVGVKIETKFGTA